MSNLLENIKELKESITQMEETLAIAKVLSNKGTTTMSRMRTLITEIETEVGAFFSGQI